MIAKWTSPLLVLILSSGLISCSSAVKVKDKEKLRTNDEYDSVVTIEGMTEEASSEVSENSADPKPESQENQDSSHGAPPSQPKKAAVQTQTSAPKKSTSPKPSAKNKGTKTTKTRKTSKDQAVKESPKEQAPSSTAPGAEDEAAKTSAHLPELEDGEGFIGRRPIVDPFRVGEKVVHEVSYFKVKAGELTLEVGPYVEVNDRKSYQFITKVKSSSVFSMFYKVDDIAVTQVDYEKLVPHAFKLDVKESKQVRDTRAYFNHETLKATFWEKKVTDAKGIEETKVSWDLLPYSQNVFSAAFYMRTFQWKNGKEYAFRVGDVDKNKGEVLVFTGKVVKREKLPTAAGTFDAVVIKPEFAVKGVFKPVGDILIWLSDDDRKIILRIESKIKIGTLVSEIIRYSPGR